MMKNTLIRLGLFTAFGVFCQPALKAQSVEKCGTDEVRKENISKHPEIIIEEEALEAFTKNYIAENGAAGFRDDDSVYVIPVVFHIIHDYGPENISDEQVFDAIKRMNEDYSKSNPDLDETIDVFVPIEADMQVEFRLAQKNLGGGCTNGIERIPSLLTYAGSDAAKLDPWQRGYYLNIWVVNVMPAGVAAYAYYPSGVTGFGATVDGIICRYDYVGSIGESAEFAAHTLSHEAGHSFNLQHPWGNNNDPGVECGDDQVPDTPETKGSTTCNLSLSVCNPPIIENVQNFMDYSYCETMFTEGQKQRVHAALNSGVSERNHLWQEETLIATGTNDGYVAPTCTPIADFFSDDRFTCEGESVTFHDVSYNATVTSRTWTFEGGTPSTSTEAEPSVSFSGTGWHKVTLSVTNGAGTDVKELDQYLYTSSETPTLNDTYYGHFDDPAEIDANWALYNKYPDDNFWQYRSTNGYGMSGCVYLNSRFGPAGDKDALISPSFNLLGTAEDNLYFKYSCTSYALFPEDITMAMKVYYSTNCGSSWILMTGTIDGTDLLTTSNLSAPFFPEKSSEWKVASFDIPEPAKSAKVKFKIEFNYDAFNNNIFIDDFNFKDFTLGLPEQQEIQGFSVSPNPVGSKGQVNINYALGSNGNVELLVYDLTGNVVANVQAGQQAEGNHQMQFDPASYHLSAGCYVIRISDGNVYKTAKLVVE